MSWRSVQAASSARIWRALATSIYARAKALPLSHNESERLPVPPDEQREILAHIRTLDIRGLSEQVMQELFRNLAMRFSFSLGNS